MKLESTIVQVDSWGDYLLVATLQRTYIGNNEKWVNIVSQYIVLPNLIIEFLLYYNYIKNILDKYNSSHHAI